MIIDERNPNLKVGDCIEGFEVKKIDLLPKLDNIMYQLEHLKTGAQLIHLSNEDENNCFVVAFRTTPMDSTGVAHILEHTALCGSKRFPVRDPFFSMIRRSMNTFMNAFTASDWTMYPFSSQTEKDFYNLMNVYLDAAFFPHLSELNFKQEGHRLEFEESDNPDSPLTIKGIVYNEMKGSMSSQSQIMHQCTGEALYPSVTYKYNSGGDPREITKLTHEQLKEFHNSHYHPSNAFFYTYGNLPLKKHLEVINRETLSEFEKISVDTMVPDESRYSEPKEFVFRYPLEKSEDDGKKVQTALAWLTPSIKEPLEVLSLQLINLILLGHSGAPLRKSLLESNLGKALADTTGYEDEIRDTWFSVGLQGVAESDVDQVETLIRTTLQEIVDQGIDEEEIELAIHQMELDTREISGGHYPYCLNLLFRFFGTWVHGGDPLKSIDFDQTLELLREKLAEGRFFEKQIQKYLIDNPHRVKIALIPDHDLEKREAEKLKEELEAIKANLSEEQKQKIIQESRVLKEYQEQVEDLSCLPTLKVSDIPETIRYVAPSQRDLDGLDVTLYERPTNGILYCNCFFSMNDLTDSEREWLPILGNLLPQVGAAGMPYEELSRQIARFTGGISAVPNIDSAFQEGIPEWEYFSVSSKSLYRNQLEMFDLLKKIINEWEFSNLKRVKTLIAQRANYMSNSIVQSGHSYASSAAKRQFGKVSAVHEVYGGIHQVRFMRDLAKCDEEELQEKLEKLGLLLKKIFRRENLSLLLIGEKDALEKSKSDLIELFNSVESFGENPKKESVKDSSTPRFQREAWLTTTPVSYVTQCHKTFRYKEKESPALLVFSNLLKSCFIHGEIREKGGAYGGMTSYDVDEGIFSLISYRDPHFARTIEIYKMSLEWLKNGTFSDQDIKEAILQTCSRIDTPMSPAGKAYSEYFNLHKGRSRELREQFRTGILSCTREDLIKAGTACLESQSSLAAVTSEDIMQREKDALENQDITVHMI